MASHVVVIDTSFRRVTVKVTPGTYMTDVIEEACKKFNLKAGNYGLKHSNKPVDISRTFRQTGLSSGAKLELVVASKSPSVVSVALQLPQSLATGVPGGRLTDKVPSDTTLWLILRKFESREGLNLNITARGIADVENGKSGAGRIFYEMPVLNIMGRELATFGDLQKTMAQLGLNSGSSLIRLAFKTTKQPLEEAMAEIGEYFKEEAADAAEEKTATTPAPKNSADAVTDAIAGLTSAETTAEEDTVMTGGELIDKIAPSTTDAGSDSTPDPAAGSQEGVILGPDGRPISIFSAPSGSTPKAALQPFNEEDFEPTIAHAKLHQSRLLNNTQNKRLPSEAEIERAEAEKAVQAAALESITIRVRYPDQTFMDLHFSPEQTSFDLYYHVTRAIVAEDQPFKLVWTGGNGRPQTVPLDQRKKLITDLKFERRTLVNFHWEDDAKMSIRSQPILKPEYAKIAREINIPDIAATKDTEVPVADKGHGGDNAPKKAKGGALRGLMKGFAKK